MIWRVPVTRRQSAMEMEAHAVPAQAVERLTRMDRTERFYKIDQLLQTRRPVVPVAEFLDELDAVLASGYGIFAGKKVQWAVLRFTPERARYVALEEWHPKQKARWEKDGSYVLEVPFTSAIELLKDILAFGPDAEVVSPPEVRAEAVSRLEKARARYR